MDTSKRESIISHDILTQKERSNSETSFFDFSSTSSNTDDSWSNYFEGWNDDQALDDYCPQVASSNSSLSDSKSTEKTQSCGDEELLPTACPRQSRTSVSKTMQNESSLRPPSKRTTKRFGIVPYSNPQAGDDAVTKLNSLLQDSMSNTEDILAAMYDPNWDTSSLQRWYQQSTKSPADLALFKIMFSLRYTVDVLSPMPP